MFRQFGMICAVLAAMTVSGAHAQDLPSLTTPGDGFDLRMDMLELETVPADPGDYTTQQQMWVFNGKLQPMPDFTFLDIEKEAVKRLFGCELWDFFGVLARCPNPNAGLAASFTSMTYIEDSYVATFRHVMSRDDGRPDDLEAWMSKLDGSPGNMAYMTCYDPVKDFDKEAAEEHVRIRCLVNGVMIRHDFWLKRHNGAET